MPNWVISSVVERFVHIEDAGSSNLSSPTITAFRRSSSSTWLQRLLHQFSVVASHVFGEVFFFAFAPRLISAFPRAAIAVCTVQHGLIRWRFRKTGERPTGRSSDGHSEAAPPPVRSCRGLHSHLRGQRGPNAIRPLSEAWIAGGIQRRGKCLQAHLRQPIQNGGMPLVENIRWPDFLE